MACVRFRKYMEILSLSQEMVYRQIQCVFIHMRTPVSTNQYFMRSCLTCGYSGALTTPDDGYVDHLD